MKLKIWQQLGIILLLSASLSAIYYVSKITKADNRILAPYQDDMELVAIPSNSMFFEELKFRQAIETAEQTKAENDIAAIITPHHLLASYIISDLMKKASGREIDTVIIIGPNHENVGNDSIATAKAKWITPVGEVQTDNRLVEKLCEKLKIDSDPNVFAKEHAIGAIAPFVKQYFPDAKIVPIAINSYAEKTEVMSLSHWLNENQDKNTLIIYSMDFSHYLTVDQANQKDLETKSLIETRDIDGITKLSNTANVDSPISLATAIEMAGINSYTTNIIHQNNSFHLLNKKPVETTSYFGITFTDDTLK